MCEETAAAGGGGGDRSDGAPGGNGERARDGAPEAAPPADEFGPNTSLLDRLRYELSRRRCHPRHRDPT